MEAVSETGMTVVLSSHIVADLERVCDHLVILSQAQTLLAGADRRGRRQPPAADRPAQRSRGGRPRPRRDPRVPHGAADVAARARERPRVRLAAGSSTTSTWRRSCSPISATAARRACATRRWRDDLAQLAPAAHRGADRGRACSPCSPRCSSRPGSRWPRRTTTTGSRLPRRAAPSRCETAIESFLPLQPDRRSIDWFTLLPGLIGVLLAAPFILSSRTGPTGSTGRRASRAVAGSPASSASRSRPRSWRAIVLDALITWWRRRSSTSRAGWTTASTTPRAPSCRLRALRARARARGRRRLAPRGAALVVRSPATSPRGSSSTRGCASGSSTRSAPPSAPTVAGPDLDKSWVLPVPERRHGHALTPAQTTPAHHLPRGRGRRRPAAFMHAVYHPNSHFWALQGIETAMFGVVAIALIAFAAWWTLRRTR